MRVMLTNALGAMRAVAGNEVYRASKAALNQLMRSYAARTADDQRAKVLMAPGWIRTELGGPNAKWARDWDQVKYCSERCGRAARVAGA